MKYLLWFIMLSVFFGCNNQQPTSDEDIQKPDSLISRELMIQILTDVHLTEAALIYLKTKGEQKQISSDDYYNVVFSKYKISRKNFTSNFDYYKHDQEDFLKMYERVINNLERLRTSGKPKR